MKVIKMLFLVIILFATKVVGGQKSDFLRHAIEKRSYPTNECQSGHMQKALSLGEACTPRDTVIPIPLLNVSAATQITPTHVSVKRCDGGCHQYGHACLPLAVKIVEIPIIMAQCGIDSGVCGKECAMVEVEEHTECSCACQLTAADCRPNQDYRQEMCSCQCHDILGRQECLDTGRVWDEGSCSCGCPLKSLETSCPYGEVYSDQACACIPESEAILLDKAAISEHKDDDDLFAQFSLEHILILVLATIILILLAILATLCTKIRSMSRRIRHLPGGGSPNGNGHLLTDSDLDVKQLHPGNPVYREGSCSTPSSGFYSEIAANERNYQQKRESDSMYHSAESVRLKKQRMELNGMCGNGGNEMVLRENELALREEGLETSSSVSRSRINIIENVLVGEDEGFIRFCPEDGSSHQIPPRMHTMEIDTRISPAGAIPRLDTNGGQCEYGTVKRPRPRLLIEEPVGPCGDGNGSGRNSPVLYGKLRLDGVGSQITTNGSLKKVKPPIPPPKSPRIYSHIVGASNGHPAAGNSYPSTPQMAHQSLVVTASDAQCQLKSSSGNNFANPHIDEALRLLQESANNL